MLEQRRAKEKGYITLKEAAVIANYSPDYVGQLIRSGKIKGEQVYSNLVWVTTEEEIQSYLSDKNRTAASTHDYNTFFSHSFFKFALYFVIAIMAILLLLLQYILYVSIDTRISEFFANSAATTQTVGL